ncbi:TetM/TetW/TetO/TetS family tetracycline resistance ribosomal protection protein [Paenibacillus anaericanus]|uniref:TetM/TetW/TetO/TetS family tetracycline resistance ribosomal protection protein n=1 Tax=Paenibacillus anaericanus TaxID=170367 RepID=A0A433YEG5_9BACL|nr:TetM/TetW/TetO/TetS family tetracycline resistance ribosomal protection protein [Paenibacillus anaericanus]RUT48257.1 TetM/TetW/TetO/TetS family tetracycline resistance ribosomal protection protein [Paenibacillus anaericanus]
MNKTIGILAHVDAGKTTFSEQLLYYTKSIKQRGRVDHKDSFLDSHQIERQRGITVFADQGMFTYGDSNYYLIDTPGHIDFSPEMERAIQAMDYAIMIISAVEGIEGQTEIVWELLQKHQIPCFFFINKIDRVGADVEQVVQDIQTNFTRDVCNISVSLSENGVMNQELTEFIAERDESLLNHYMEEGYSKDRWLGMMQLLIQENKIFPYACGSALQGMGIDDFLQKLDQLTVTNYSNEGSFAGRVYRIRHDDLGTKITYIKALSGTLKVRDIMNYGDPENTVTEKITGIRIYNGREFKAVDTVGAGELFAVTGLSMTTVGDGIGALQERATYEMVPTLKSKVIFEPSVNVKEALKYFKILNAEDPSLNVTWEESLQEIHIHVMGKIQLEVLEQLVKERFNLNILFDKPEILYKETIATEVIGYGHFEPLGHYAEVHLQLRPGERNSGVSFHNACHADDLSVGNQNLVRHHIFEREHHGLLTGSPLTDVIVTLLNGRAHNKHTTGGDFREATYRALRQGLEQADNLLLEPYYNFKIKVDLDHIGRVISDIERAHGSFEAPRSEGNKVILTGRVPVVTFMDYNSRLASFTQGKSSLSLTFAGYERCHNEQEVINEKGYNKDADAEYISSSIFCAKGQGYTVGWEEAESKMHGL